MFSGAGLLQTNNWERFHEGMIQSNGRYTMNLASYGLCILENDVSRFEQSSL